MQMKLEVRPITRAATRPWLIDKHYAHRMPQICYAFGLFIGDELRGVITYGSPASSTLRKGIAGEDNAHLVLELNRLCCDNEPNFASQLIAKSLRLLPKPRIIVSFADTAQAHIGYVYQATNFTYTGLSAKRTDWCIKGMEGKHGVSIADISRGQPNRAEFMRNKFGDDFYLTPRSRKHRYIFILGNKKERKQLWAAIRYPKVPYPKGQTP